MRNILVTGGTAFVSRYVAEYFVSEGDRVYVLNRGNRKQSKGVIHINGDRKHLADELKGYFFDAVLDVTAYTDEDVRGLLDALYGFGEYILVSSSAVYPENTVFPCEETADTGANAIWGDYGTNKIKAEKELLDRVPHAYILRPPYLYGKMQNLYREPFVFDCAKSDRAFVLPQRSRMNLQFFDVEDLCRFMDILIEKKPKEHIFNVGNCETVSVREWVELCYEVAGKKPVFLSADDSHPVRSYFCFYDYEYILDVAKMHKYMPDTKPLLQGLKEEYEWYKAHEDGITKKPYIQYIDKYIL